MVHTITTAAKSFLFCLMFLDISHINLYSLFSTIYILVLVHSGCAGEKTSKRLFTANQPSHGVCQLRLNRLHFFFSFLLPSIHPTHIISPATASRSLSLSPSSLSSSLTCRLYFCLFLFSCDGMSHPSQQLSSSSSR